MDLDVVPLPNARLLGSRPIFLIPSEQSVARQPLNILDRGIIQSEGYSHLAQSTLNEIRPFLDEKVVTNL